MDDLWELFRQIDSLPKSELNNHLNQVSYCFFSLPWLMLDANRSLFLSLSAFSITVHHGSDEFILRSPSPSSPPSSPSRRLSERWIDPRWHDDDHHVVVIALVRGLPSESLHVHIDPFVANIVFSFTTWSQLWCLDQFILPTPITIVARYIDIAGLSRSQFSHSHQQSIRCCNVATDQLSSTSTRWLSYALGTSVFQYQCRCSTDLLRFGIDRSVDSDAILRCNAHATEEACSSRSCQTADECFHGLFPDWTSKNGSTGSASPQCRHQQVCSTRETTPGFVPSLHDRYSRCCGAKWKRMSLRERQPYMEESERLKHLHARQYPTYKVSSCSRETSMGCMMSVF